MWDDKSKSVLTIKQSTAHGISTEGPSPVRDIMNFASQEQLDIPILTSSDPGGPPMVFIDDVQIKN